MKKTTSQPAGKQGQRRKSILDLSWEARDKYPDKDSHWWNTYAAAQSKILGFEKDFGHYKEVYKLDVVLLLVNVLDRDTRSPAKKQAVADWRVNRVHD
jgi:hypothetical protein